MRASEDQLHALMIRGLGGEAAAHHALLSALAPLLRRFFGRRLHDTADVEDLVQDTLIAIHTRRESYDPARPFTGWAFAIARYKMIDAFRRRRAAIPIDGLEDFLSDGGFEDAESARMDVAALLDTLPPKQRQVIRATRIEGRSVAEVATSEGLSESDVKVSVHRGLKALAARIAGARR